MNGNLQAKKFGGITLAVFLSLCPTDSLSAQKAVRSNQNGARRLERVNKSKEVRERFEQGEADGLNVTIYQLSANGMVAVNPRKAFKNGDRFRLKLRSNFDGYIYVVNVTPGGENRLLFPRAQSRHNNVRAGQFYYIPAANHFQFNDEPGLEILQILMSKTPVAVLEKVLDRTARQGSHIPLDASTTRSLEEIVGKPALVKTGGITIKTSFSRNPGLQTRMLKLDRKTESTFVVVSDVKGTPSRFRPGEVSVLEIRLNHL